MLVFLPSIIFTQENKNKSIILQKFWEWVTLWPYTLVKSGGIRKAYGACLWWWDKYKICKSITSDIVYDTSITSHVLISLLNIKMLTQFTKKFWKYLHWLCRHSARFYLWWQGKNQTLLCSDIWDSVWEGRKFAIV